MNDNQLNRFEGILTQLVSMVGILCKDVSLIKADLADVKTDLANVKTELADVKADLSDVRVDVSNLKLDLAQVKETQQRQHAELLGKLELLRVDHEITWAKTVENERQIERLKKH